MIFGHFYAQNGGFKAAKSNLLGWRIVNATARFLSATAFCDIMGSG